MKHFTHVDLRNCSLFLLLASLASGLANLG